MNIKISTDGVNLLLRSTGLSYIGQYDSFSRRIFLHGVSASSSNVGTDAVLKEYLYG
jgi:hypothetical protein